jgi:hypothetical protein
MHFEFFLKVKQVTVCFEFTQEEGPIPTNDSQAGSRVTTPAAASKPQTPSKSVTTSVSASRPTSSKPGPADVMLVHTDSGSRPSTAASHVSFAGDETFATTPAVPVFVSTLQLCSAVRVHGGVNADNLPPIEQYVGMFQTFYASVLESIDAAIGYGTGGASYVELYRTGTAAFCANVMYSNRFLMCLFAQPCVTCWVSVVVKTNSKAPTR